MRTISVAILAGILGLAEAFSAQAAGLGRLTVLSPLGSPLNAEIEIVSLQPGEEDGLSARLAPAEAYRLAKAAIAGMLPVSNTLKPVARMRTSTSCSTPSVVRTPAGVIVSIGVVSSVTSSRSKVFRYSLWKLGRLQPRPYCGRSFSRVSGSLTCELRNCSNCRSPSLPSGSLRP